MQANIEDINESKKKTYVFNHKKNIKKINRSGHKNVENS